jgi:septal ring factor EnvC (AmiA/AmiB activator)
MNMIPTAEHIARVAGKVAKLVKDFRNLRKEHDKLKEELIKRKETEENLKDRCRMLENQLNLLKATSGQLEGQERKDLEKQLNHYIREIDKCISLLGQ